MCAPGTIETVRRRFEQEEGLVRLDRRTALLAGAGAALAATLPGGARAARARGGSHAQDLTHLFRIGFPMFVGAPPPERRTHVTVPVNGFYGQIWTIWEHTATHLDVPAHFVEGVRVTPDLRLDELIAPIAVIDISERAASDPDTVVTADDVHGYERRHGRIKRGSIVAMNSGWEARVGSEAAYRNIGSDGLQHFPGFGVDALEVLLDRRAAAIGVDTLSLDPGNSTTFAAHVKWLGSDKFGMENLANLGKIPPKGATAIVGVIPWQDGSGGPARVLATW